MQLPTTRSSGQVRVRFGRSVIARLRQAKLDELAATAEAATAEVKRTDRALEDALEPVQDAMAARDYWDDELDDVAKSCRMRLAARSLDATTQPPYTVIFHKGIGYYTAAPVAEEESRYRELITRIVETLDEDDELRAPTVEAINDGLTHYLEFTKTLAEARTALNIARTNRDVARESWEKQMEKIYGALIAELGRRRAERFFPRTGRGQAPHPGDATDDTDGLGEPL